MIMVVVEAPCWILSNISSGSDVSPAILTIFLFPVPSAGLIIALSRENREPGILWGGDVGILKLRGIRQSAACLFGKMLVDIP